MRSSISLFQTINLNNMSKLLSELEIIVVAADPISISFALLQNHLKSLMCVIEHVTVYKMDIVLFELYTHYYSLQKQYFNGGVTTKNMLAECNDIIQNCKEDRQELYKVSEDRLRLVKELKTATDETLQLMEQNEKLKTMITAHQDLNNLLSTRYYQMEEQLSKLTQNKDIKNSVKGLEDKYSKIISENSQMQRDITDLSRQSNFMEQFSLPIRVLNIAFKSNKSLKQLVLRQAQHQLGENQQLRNIFLNFSFDLGEVKK